MSSNQKPDGLPPITFVRDRNFQPTGIPINNPQSIQVLVQSGIIESLSKELIVLAEEFLKDLRERNKDCCRSFLHDVSEYRAITYAWNIPAVQTLLDQSKYQDIKQLIIGPCQAKKLQQLNKAILWHITGKVEPTKTEVTFGADAYDRGSILPASSSFSSLLNASSPEIFRMSSPRP